MLKPVTHITITTKENTLFFDFVTHWEYNDGWQNLTSNGKVVFPKNIYVTDTQTQKRFQLFGANKSINALFKRGDKIKIETFYIYWDRNLNEKRTTKVIAAEGYISKVGSGMPIEIEFEDNMWLLKQIPLKNQSFAKGTSIESILTDALQGTGLTVNYLTTTKLVFDNALLSAENETVAQFLAKLRKDAFLFSYFRGSELRVGSFVYIEAEAKQKKFVFQDNIISSDLSYSNKNDIVLSAVASNHITENTGQTTKDGYAKTRNKRIEVLVTLKNDKVIVKEVAKGEKADPNTDGERRTFTFLQARTTKELADLAEAELRKYYYTGFKGSFTTFGTPYVQFGDNAQIVNDKLNDQTGIYKIKEVEYSGGIDGYRQKITLDYKINTDA
ncbi:MAG: hypothetical protein H7296_04550 [Bacteroidia bacterium]|nr:hypothetical protein [Bacteroidia bacterium]